jgi:hypothetical protein
MTECIPLIVIHDPQLVSTGAPSTSTQRAWDAVTRCPHPQGIDAEVVSRVEAAMSYEAGKDQDRRLSTSSAAQQGVLPPSAAANVFDVYKTPEDKEIHDLIIRLGLSERDGNDLLYTLRKVDVMITVMSIIAVNDH